MGTESTSADDIVAIADPSTVDRQRLAAEFRATAAVRVVTAAAVEDLRQLPAPSPRYLVLSPSAEAAITEVKRARDLYPAAVTVVTAHLPTHVAFALGRSGVHALLPKPVSANEIISVIRSPNGRVANDQLPSLARAEWEYLQGVLALCSGNRSEAARRLGIHRSVLQRKLARTAPPR